MANSLRGYVLKNIVNVKLVYFCGDKLNIELTTIQSSN